MLHFDISKCAPSGMLLLAGSPSADPGVSAWILQDLQILHMCQVWCREVLKGRESTGPLLSPELRGVTMLL